MKRGFLAVAGLLALYAAAGLLGASIMRPYLVAWLVCLSIPVGALPIVLGLELAGLGGALQTGYLRWMLPLLPVLALAGLPLLFFVGVLYPWVAQSPPGLAGSMLRSTGFVLRSLVYLSIWSVLGVVARRPPADAPRRMLCASGLALHAATGTLAALDWIMSLTPGLDSPGFGLMVMVGQSALAVSVGLLLVPARPPLAGAVLLGCLVAWALLQFTHYLIVWSADRPAEIALYIRGGLMLDALAVGGIVALVAATALMAPAKWVAGRAALLTAAALAAVVQIVAMFWLAGPSLMGGFGPPMTGPSAAMGLVCLSGAVLWALRPRPVSQ